METYTLIPVVDFCDAHCVEITLVKSFNDHGLIAIVEQEQALFIPEPEVKKLEQIIVFYRDLDINLEGIETIFMLLERIEALKNHVNLLENKLIRFL